MEGTVLVRPEREEFMAMLGEMVQMVNEAVRRRASTVRDASKPLSLEYMGDRFDIDDPLVGYLAVTKDEGWLQGFVTCTCFTTWHRNFRWDSTNPSLDLLHAHPSAGGDASPAERKAPPAVDADGSLACELQAELHGGDPDGEGIVWPRIAELSLLGALGCGRWLVELIIGELEASGDYSYIVTQATDGSIPFYERMGFVRVGAVTLAPKSDAADGSAKRAGGSEGKGSSGKGSSGKGSLGGKGSGGKGSSGAKGSSSAKGGSPGKGSSGGDAKGVGGDGGGGSSSGGASSGKKRKAPAPPKRPQPVYSAYVEHRTEATGAVEETAEGLAGRYGVPVADLLFLNSARFPKLAASSVLRKDTKYLVPRPRTATEVEEEAKAMHSAWYVCKEEMPFKKVAEECAVEPREMLRLNAGRAELKGLMISSELIRGTRLLVKPEEYDVDEYCHWTFPDDDPSKAEPSYMMARRLQRKPAGSGADASSVLSRSQSLLVEKRPAVLPSGKRAAYIQAIQDRKAEVEAARKAWADQAWHVVEEDITFKKKAEELSIDPRMLRDMNCGRLKGLQLSSFLKKDTWLQVKPLDEMNALVEKTTEQVELINRVVQIDGEDDYEYW